MLQNQASFNLITMSCSNVVLVYLKSGHSAALPDQNPQTAMNIRHLGIYIFLNDN